jgi:hypothetical protein
MNEDSREASASETPEDARDRALRFTFLRPFDEAERLEALEQIAAALLGYSREAGLWRWDDVCEELGAVAEDFEALGAYLGEVAAELTGHPASAADRLLARRASGWARDASYLGRDIRRAIGAEEPLEEPLSAPTFLHTLATDLRRVIEHTRELLPAPPGGRGDQALEEALAMAAEVEALAEGMEAQKERGPRGAAEAGSEPEAPEDPPDGERA